ncbi:MAG: hypothetical protein WCO55_06270 [Candidatus Falkowbacteria bacterium]
MSLVAWCVLAFVVLETISLPFLVRYFKRKADLYIRSAVKNFFVYVIKHKIAIVGLKTNPDTLIGRKCNLSLEILVQDQASLPVANGFELNARQLMMVKAVLGNYNLYLPAATFFDCDDNARALFAREDWQVQDRIRKEGNDDGWALVQEIDKLTADKTAGNQAVIQSLNTGV